MTDEIKRMQEHLVTLEAFLASPAHSGYVAAREVEIENIQTRILSIQPRSQSDIADLLLAHGELDSQVEMLKTFEEARVTLEARINDAIERENKNTTAQKV